MNKAFIFDLDGVLIDDESIWEDKKQSMYRVVLGEEVSKKIGSTLGINVDGIFDKAISAGAAVSKEEFAKEFNSLAGGIYSEAPIPEGVIELEEALRSLGYRIGIVSASPLSWITTVTKRLPFEDNIELIISLHDRPDLAHKPDPEGYVEAMKFLEASPESTIVLEDSNSGIKAAKSSGAFTVGLKQNLVSGYEQIGADAYADTMQDVIELAKNHAGSQE